MLKLSKSKSENCVKLGIKHESEATPLNLPLNVSIIGNHVPNEMSRNQYKLEDTRLGLSPIREYYDLNQSHDQNKLKDDTQTVQLI